MVLLWILGSVALFAVTSLSWEEWKEIINNVKE